jgi:hypothetical protein
VKLASALNMVLFNVYESVHRESMSIIGHQDAITYSLLHFIFQAVHRSMVKVKVIPLQA